MSLMSKNSVCLYAGVCLLPVNKIFQDKRKCSTLKSTSAFYLAVNLSCFDTKCILINKICLYYYCQKNHKI